MDGSAFDRLARSLVTERSRRGVVGGLLGLAAGLAGVGAAGAQTCPPGRVRRRGVGCVCRRTGRPPVGGTCPCPRGQCDFGAGCVAAECCADADCNQFVADGSPSRGSVTFATVPAGYPVSGAGLTCVAGVCSCQLPEEDSCILINFVLERASIGCCACPLCQAANLEPRASCCVEAACLPDPRCDN